MCVDIGLASKALSKQYVVCSNLHYNVCFHLERLVQLIFSYCCIVLWNMTYAYDY